MDINIVIQSIATILMAGVLFCCVSLGIVQIIMLRKKFIRPANKRMHMMAMGLVWILVIKSFTDLVGYWV